MKLWPILPMLVVALAGGCRSNANRELVERELRMMEDDIYHLEDHLDDYCAQLESCRRENAALRRKLSESRRSDSPYDPGEMAPPRLDIELPDEALEYEGRRQVDSGDDELSYVDDILPLPDDERTSSSPARPGKADSQHGYVANQFGPTDEDEIDDYEVASITINRFLTGGYNKDGHLGDEGLMVVVEPRNAAGQVINVTGELSIVVVDPADPDGPSVARWDFKPDEVAAHFRRGVMAQGIQIRMPWPGEPPHREDLHVYARLMMPGGDQFRADHPIKVELLPGVDPDNWKLAEPRQRSHEEFVADRRSEAHVEDEPRGAPTLADEPAAPDEGPEIDTPAPRPARHGTEWTPYR